MDTFICANVHKRKEIIMEKKEMMSDVNAMSGPVGVRMTNDYLFRALLQRNNKVLKGLICSLLHLKPEQVQTVKITNPIELGKEISDKIFILDIKVLLNDNTIVNLEMQVVNEHDWPERSLSYLCRSFDNLNQGEGYKNSKSVVQIGFLDYTLFPKNPEFYSTYKFLNVKSYTKYSDKLCISVVDLTKIDLATKEDKQYGIDYWASLFKSTTWEEIKMLAQDNEYIKAACDTLYQLTRDEEIRQQIEAREDYYRRQIDLQIYMREQEERMQEQQERMQEQQECIQEQENIIRERENLIQEQNSTIRERENLIQEQNNTIRERENVIQEQNSTIRAQEDTIQKQDNTIVALQAEIERLKSHM